MWVYVSVSSDQLTEVKQHHRRLMQANADLQQHVNELEVYKNDVINFCRGVNVEILLSLLCAVHGKQ